MMLINRCAFFQLGVKILLFQKQFVGVNLALEVVFQGIPGLLRFFARGDQGKLGTVNRQYNCRLRTLCVTANGKVPPPLLTLNSLARTSEPSKRFHNPFAIKKCFILNFQVFQLLQSSFAIYNVSSMTHLNGKLETEFHRGCSAQARLNSTRQLTTSTSSFWAHNLLFCAA